MSGVLWYLRARYYDPGTGRFTARDAFPGYDNNPITLHKYIYAGNDPVFYTDPSGQFALAGLGAGMRGSAGLGGIGAATARQAAELLKMVLVMQLASDRIEAALGYRTAADVARYQQELRGKVSAFAAANGVSAEDLLYHYTDPDAARAIFLSKVMFASRRFTRHPDGNVRPSGAYATQVPPWVVVAEKQRYLAEFYAFPKGRSADAVVVIAQDGGWRPVPYVPVEWYKPGATGSSVPVAAIGWAVLP